MMSIADVLLDLGEICTTHTCNHCPLKELARNGNGCPELLHIRANANKVAEIIALGTDGDIKEEVGHGKTDIV